MNLKITKLGNIQNTVIYDGPLLDKLSGEPAFKLIAGYSPDGDYIVLNFYDGTNNYEITLDYEETCQLYTDVFGWFQSMVQKANGIKKKDWSNS